jgi:hypothetical protein
MMSDQLHDEPPGVVAALSRLASLSIEDRIQPGLSRSLEVAR